MQPFDRLRANAWGWVAVLCALLFALTTPASAQTFPRFTNYVVDTADVLSPDQERALNEGLGLVQRLTGHQFAIVTVTSLRGLPIENYARTLGNHWGVGRKGANDGVLLVVAPIERKLRIAVGDGLRKMLTDREAASIIDRAILPRFRAGNIAAGILAGAAGIIRELSPMRSAA